jgi:SagB-type dehydrogenase family enzyme
MLLRTNPAVRLKSPSFLLGSKWVAEDFLQRRRFSLPEPAILLLVACMHPQPMSEVIADIAGRLALSLRSVENIINSLLDKQLLLTSLPENVRRFEEIREQWSSYGWIEAAEYHLATYDYEFVGADEEGRQASRQRMNGYSAQEEDRNRLKRYPEASVRIPLLETDSNLLPIPASIALTDKAPSRSVDSRIFATAISMAFGKIGIIKVPQLEWGGAPAIRRSSPSGGARHPTEAYVVIVNVPELKPGWYHVAIDPPELELLREGDVGASDLACIFPTSYARAPFPVAAIVILTSLFERNMYRYREPRTFRTIHMDAGHLAASLEFIARTLGVRTFVQYWANEEIIEQRLGLHALEEGFLLSVAVG